jgi:hypothetical protein
MSGSGGGGSYDYNPRPAPKPAKGDGDGGGLGGGVDDPCSLEEIAALNSPVPAVIRGLRVGDQLAVVYVPGPPRLLLAQHNGATAGSITSPSQLQIIDCIATRGIGYTAEVISVRGSAVQVRITRQ